MSNKKAVNNFYKKMRSKGFRNMSFLVHSDDLETVKTYVNQLKQKRLATMLISPSETVTRLKKLKLSNEQFQMIHHKANETSDKHCHYLSDKGRYQENSKNYDVALRVQCITEAIKDKVSIEKAISKCLKKTPFS